AQDHRVQDIEDDAVGGEAHGQGHDHEEAHARSLRQRAEREAYVVEERWHRTSFEAGDLAVGNAPGRRRVPESSLFPTQPSGTPEPGRARRGYGAGDRDADEDESDLGTYHLTSSMPVRRETCED